MKEIFTRKQAVAILSQVKSNPGEIDIFATVDPENKLFKLTNEELYQKLSAFIPAHKMADVVDEPTFA